MRDKQLDGFRFRRQRSIGKYIVDFVCDDAKLIVELSDKPKEASPSEKARAAYFKAQGYLVLQLLNNEVSAHIKTGLAAIRKHLKADVVEVVTVATEEVVKKAKRAVKAKIVAALEVGTEVGTEAAAETTEIKKKSVAKKPAAPKPTTKNPTTKKPAAKKPAEKKVVESDE